MHLSFNKIDFSLSALNAIKYFNCSVSYTVKKMQIEYIFYENYNYKYSIFKVLSANIKMKKEKK